MKAKWQEISEKYSARPLRERAIIGALILVLFWGIFDLALLAPLNSEKDELEARFDASRQQLKQYMAQEMVLAKVISEDPNADRKKEIARLEKYIETLDKNLQDLSVGLISASELPAALHDVLKSVGTLKLTGMETRAPSQLRLIGEESNSSEAQTPPSEADEEANIEKALAAVEKTPDEQEKKTGVFKHSVIVELEGDYFDVVTYLQALEAMPWRFYWQALEYEVTSYPTAKIRMEVYTLSTEQGVLGV